MRNNTGRYTFVAIILHWMIAAAILANLGLGAWMHEAIEDPGLRDRAYDAFQWHKSIGLTVLALSVLRLVWRFLFPPPPLPAGMSVWEKRAAVVTHWLFYALMIAIPLSGWIYVSAQWRGDGPFTIPTLWFGLFEVPHLFGLNQAPAEVRESAATNALGTHETLAWMTVALLLMHVAAALRHQFLRHDGVLARMLPLRALGAREAGEVSAGPRRHGVAAIVTVIAAVGFVWVATITPAVPEAEENRSAAVLERLVSEQSAVLPEWRVNPETSHIRFAGEHAGRPFTGHFEKWRAAIHFDPAQPEQSSIVAVVETGSAVDGVPLHEKTLPEAEWFNVAEHPFATYHSTAVSRREAGRYAVEGTLSIKGNGVALPALELVVEDDALHITGKVSVDRADVDMGMESDPDGQYVSREIDIAVQVRAARETP